MGVARGKRCVARSGECVAKGSYEGAEGGEVVARGCDGGGWKIFCVGSERE